MSYNGSGTFNINSTGQPVVAGTVITASAFNALTTDLATGLTTAITKDGQTTTTARITFAQGITSSLVTDSSSVSTGSIITDGGMGVAKNLYVGGTLNVTGSTSLTNPVINNIKMGYTTTATAAGTTTLTVASNYRQFFTGSTTQTIVLPVTSTLVTGMAYEIENNSTGLLTVNSSGGNLVGTIPSGVCAHAVCIGTTLTTAADWDWDYISTTTITGTGANVLATSPTITTPTINQITSAAATALTLQSAGTTAVTIATNQAITVASTGGGITYSSSAGSGLRMYGSAGTNQWDVYGNGANIRFSDNTGGGIVVVDTAARIGSTIGVGGTTPSASGAGVSFPTTQSASSDANTLDDYEEGTWTPNQGAGLTVVGTFSSTGAYTKVGRMVYVRGVVQATSSISCSSGTAITSNLPFSCVGDNAGGGFNGSLLAGTILDFTSTTVFTTASMAASTVLFFTGTYTV
jgi:hypothetical protein